MKFNFRDHDAPPSPDHTKAREWAKRATTESILGKLSVTGAPGGEEAVFFGSDGSYFLNAEWIHRELAGLIATGKVNFDFIARHVYVAEQRPAEPHCQNFYKMLYAAAHYFNLCTPLPSL